MENKTTRSWQNSLWLWKLVENYGKIVLVNDETVLDIGKTALNYGKMVIGYV